MILLTLILMFATTPAAAHSWYPIECCSDKDCSVVPSEQVQVTPAGYMVNGWHVAFSQAKASPDEEYHACISQGFNAPRRIKCFWAPKGST